ncbi:MAG: hypothetical protein LBC65_04365, partial [Oscillospiraceae bacterium]|nr:hypothetical protein [Oscillospiraceae bacterium]
FSLQSAEVKENIRKQAERNLRIELILREIAKRENIELTEEDKTREYAALADSYGVDTESVKTFIDPDAFEHSVLMRKIADRICELSVALPEPEPTADAPELEAPAAQAESPAETPKRPRNKVPHKDESASDNSVTESKEE